MKLTTSGVALVAIVTMGSAGCTNEEVGSVSQELAEDATGIAEHQWAWDGRHSVPAVTRDRPARPPLPEPASQRFLDRLHRASRAETVVVRATVLSLSSDYWETPPVGSGWLGPHVATEVELSVGDWLCGVADEPLVAVFRGGKAGIRTEVAPADFPAFLEVGSEYVFWLTRKSDHFYLARAKHDILVPESDRTFTDRDGTSIEMSDIRGVCP